MRKCTDTEYISMSEISLNGSCHRLVSNEI
jgi:hypothetical protein